MIAVSLAALCLGIALGLGFEPRLHPETCEDAELKFSLFVGRHSPCSGSSMSRGPEAMAFDPPRYRQLLEDMNRACDERLH